MCVYPASNSVDDATGRYGRNGGVFDIFRTLLVNPNTGILTTSGYMEVQIILLPACDIRRANIFM